MSDASNVLWITQHRRPMRLATFQQQQPWTIGWRADIGENCTRFDRVDDDQTLRRVQLHKAIERLV